MLSVRIYREKDEDIIYLEGDLNLIKPLHDAISDNAWVRHPYREFIYKDIHSIWNPGVYTAISFGVWNLKKINGDSLIADQLLSYIDTNKIKIDERTRYLLAFWRFECQMLNINKSYRSEFPKYSQHLTSLGTLNEVLDRCKDKEYTPSFSDLFKLLENSKNAKERCCAPSMPSEPEINDFIKSSRPAVDDAKKSQSFTHSSLFRLPNVVDKDVEQQDKQLVNILDKIRNKHQFQRG